PGAAQRRVKDGPAPATGGASGGVDALEQQDSEIEAFDYSWSHFWTTPREGRHPAQLPCWITWLEAEGTQHIAAHLGQSAMYGGAIASRGPRYCPSVEDKVVKFPDKSRHQLFLEPEGHDTREMYVNGLSTSLPADVQLAVMRTVRGLEQVRMTRAGYAIEYDYYPPTQLDASLQSRAIAGLFFAGQVNGTTGYEEAAGQGVLAGINAAHHVLEREALILGRETSYIGVLIDDLVTRGVDEPYRLFTSRSEFRLTVRQDNALARLGPRAAALGLLTEAEEAHMGRRLGAVREALRLAEATSMPPAVADPVLEAVGSRPLPHAVRAAELAKRQDVALASLFAAAGVGGDLPGDAVVGAELEIKYAGYFEKERARAARLAAQGNVRLPGWLVYEELTTLSVEARQKLTAVRPSTMAQASSIPGISPADLQNLLFELHRTRVPGDSA
ncbi:MAG: tRNA uridine-5-carboxymethylaminomethyl(34) synthesis enzyme MnmG, partial [Gemmatimonadaceae bacterium]|nr:tRNA uridine-5-carboxymethylaminomethyl(34) synthesis enzyme MnmG [Gemmatimonadaceae bacterium]